VNSLCCESLEDYCQVSDVTMTFCRQYFAEYFSALYGK